MENSVSLLDNDDEKGQSGFLDNLLDEVKTPFDMASIANALAKRSQKNAQRLKNWTGAHHVEVKAAD